MTNQDYKNAALAALKGNWAPAVLTSIVYVLILGAIGCGPMFFGNPSSTSFVVANACSPLLVYLIAIPLEIGFFYAFVKLLREGDNDILGNTFRIGFTGWLRTVATMFVTMVVVMLGMLLLIIPGVILAFAYSMVPFLLVKHPELSITEVLRTSRLCMRGHKFDYFWLCLSFMGWVFLSILTLGIGYFWLLPYMSTAIDAFWLDVYSQTHPETEE